MSDSLWRPGRRSMILGAAALGATGTGLARAAAGDPFAALEAETGGRIGVAALDGHSGRLIGWRLDERFAMASTFKVLLAAAVLAQVDRGRLRLDQAVPYSEADLLSYAPRTRSHLGQGAMNLADLCAAALEVSDNTAANLLLPLVGGPAGVTARLRRWGDPVTRLDRTEPTLNTNLPGDPRDTATPRSFARTLRRVLTGSVLSPASRARLAGWMIACETGSGRLRGGLPPGWRAGDKTGTGENGAVNDVAIAWPPDRAPIIIAAFMSAPGRSADELGGVHGKIARMAIQQLVRPIVAA